MTIANPYTASRIADPQTVALEVLGHLQKAWNDGDGEAFGSNYAPNASFVNIRGEHIVGRTAIAAGHTGIFTTIYAGSVNRMSLAHASEISTGIVLAVSVNTLDCPSGPMAGVHTAISTTIISSTVDGAGRPLIVSTHNTLVTAALAAPAARPSPHRSRRAVEAGHADCGAGILQARDAVGMSALARRRASGGDTLATR